MILNVNSNSSKRVKIKTEMNDFTMNLLDKMYVQGLVDSRIIDNAI